MSRLIKKYKNRRLYDTELSQYITIETLRQYVLDGLPFKVEDASDGRDLTNPTLLQILVEMETGSTQLMSTAFIRQLILFANHPMHALLSTHLDQWMSVMEQQLKTSTYLNDFQKAGETWEKGLQAFFKNWPSA